VYAGLHVLFAVLLFPAVQDWLKQDLEAFRIPSGAMEPTLQIGEFLYVAKWPSMRTNLTHGSVVVFDSVEEPGLKVVKRVAGLPGDTIAMVRGVFHRNGRSVPESYLPGVGHPRSESDDQRAKMRAWQVAYVTSPDTTDYAPDLGDWGPLVVPEQFFFALGDNREASYDSRYYGFVPTANVIGQPVVIYFSFDPDARGFPLAKVRWNRIGQRLR
jgi:signal peptidase I